MIAYRRQSRGADRRQRDGPGKEGGGASEGEYVRFL